MTNAQAALIAAASQVPYDGPGRTDETLHRAGEYLKWLGQQATADRPPASTTTERGYGGEHRRTRLAALAHLEPPLGLPCWRCGRPMYYEAGANLDLGHDDNDRTKYRGLEHSGRCNRAAGAAKGTRARGSRRHLAKVPAVPRAADASQPTNRR